MRHAALAVLLASIAPLAACSSADDPGTSTADATAAAFEGEVAPLADFAYDTGLVPAASPAQIALKLAAGGAVRVSAGASRDGEALVGRAGSGKLAIDVHVTMEGALKVATALKNYDGPIPGIENLDIPIAAEVPFDPFLVGDGEEAVASAEVPETELPAIPLGSVPGSLKLTVAQGSTLTSAFHGTCIAVADGTATYDGSLATSGTLKLRGVIALELPAPLNKEVDIGTIEIPIPAVTTPIALGSMPAPGVADMALGAACAAGGAGAEAPSTPGSGKANGGGSSGAPDPAPAVASTLTGAVSGNPVTFSDVVVKAATSRGIAGFKLTAKAAGKGLGPNASLVVFLSRRTTYCDRDAQYLSLDADNLGTSPYSSNSDPCYLTATALPGDGGDRVAGFHTGKATTFGGQSVTVDVRFDAPLTP